jgi:SAM-dependent methyltransferase
MKVQEIWDRRAERYDGATGVWNEVELRRWMDVLDEEIGSRWEGLGVDDVVEVGPGTGAFSGVLLRYARRSFGVVEVSPAMHERWLAKMRAFEESRGRMALRISIAPVPEEDEPIPFDGDLVAGRLVLRHLGDLDGAVRRLARMVRPDGKLVLAEGFAPAFGGPAWDLYREAMGARTGARGIFTHLDLVQSAARVGFSESRIVDVSIQVSLAKWIASTALLEAERTALFEVHDRAFSLGGEAAIAYRAKRDGDDWLMNWRRSLLVFSR